ncbi:olfactory receptor 10A7-like [Dermochelys coriacea]|uniref:olfactory receptor 10A7-like n=1 Tax=Dermochelys coriacea TaxID=27794 RepID=UPI0018E80B48|nr:olfactory receptor 10A7-like [Dermochelys coriacea]
MKYAEDLRRGNLTMVTEFILLGLYNHRELEVPLFSIYLLIYTITLTGKILTILITMDTALHTPMYFFLQVLSFLEICYTSVTVPKMLVNFLSEDRSISYMGCVAQIYFLGISECFLLADMAYDHYVAICNPLRYRLIMKRVCLSLTVLSWFSGNVVSLVQTAWVFNLPFCGYNQINYFFCDIPPLIKLSCTDTSSYEMQLFTATVLVNFTLFFLILVSYTFIISTILKMVLTDGRHKAFSTCSSLLIVVTLYYGSSGLIYLRPKSINSLDSNKVLALMYTTITPYLNPIVFSLSNNEVKGAVQRLLWDGLKRKIFSQRK